jgi:hypothetical protein
MKSMNALTGKPLKGSGSSGILRFQGLKYRLSGTFRNQSLTLPNDENTGLGVDFD